MVYLIKAIGILIFALGMIFVVKPSLITSLMEFVKKNVAWIYAAGVLRIVLGGLLLWASPHASIKWLTVVMGCLLALTGIGVFVLGMKRVHAYMDWWAAKSENAKRGAAAIAIAIGVLIIYSA